jgi:RNA polymerase sigma factor (sigma-70 family)
VDDLTDPALIRAMQSETPARREKAWALFEPFYRPTILAWCRRRVSQWETAEDLTQEILLKLSAEFTRRCYDPELGRFRSWLKTLVNNFLTDYWRAQRRRVAGPAIGGSDHLLLLAGLESPEAAEELSDAIVNHEVTKAVRTIDRVRSEVREDHWRAFWLYHAENLPVVEIAAAVGLEVGNVYKILRRIKKQLTEANGHV